MKLDKVRRIRKRLVVCIMGGPLASISFGLLAVVGGEVGLARSDSGWPTALEFLGVWSLLLGFPGLFPHVARGFAMDGMMLRSLWFRKTEAMQAIALHALMVPDNNALLSPDYYARWFRLASLAAPTDAGQYYANWLGYMTEVDNCKAAQLLESCLAQAAFMAEIHRDKLIAEAVYFMAYRRNEIAKAEVWHKRLAERLNPISQLRIKAAMSCARGQLEDALNTLEHALSMVHKLPMTAERQRFEASWEKWRQEIERRVRTPVFCS